MPFLTSKNFTAPLTNKTNLLTILCITVVFATFRLSGGSLAGNEDQSRGEAVQPATSLGSSRLGDSVDSPEGQDVLQDMLSTKNSKKVKRGLAAEEDAPAGGGLEEIERAIGLR
jgi:hypothetical protein